MEASALREWEHHNQIECVDPKRDALFYHDAEKEKQVNAARPWANDPHYFKHTKISAVALIKMTMHARSGGELEIMGLMQGYTDGDTIVVTDAFRLPVEGTETRVNAQDEANEYIINFLDAARAHGRSENIVGWYHSHPGYGCWLSGIDVDTQILQQTYQDPSVAVVIDPDRTISSGKVEIGAFRTLTKVQGQPEAEQDTGALAGGNGSGSSAVPLAKVAEFGKHASRYYPLEVSHFKSTLDTRLLEDLWHKYWVQTLSQNPLVTNREYGNKQMLDLSSKIRETTVKLKGSMGMGQVMGAKAADAAYEKLVEDAKLIASKERSGLMAAEVKAKIFNDIRQDT